LRVTRALKQRYSFPNIIGKSDRMLRLLDLVGQVASSRSTILITGETGTGKELTAKAIHTNSPRAERLFVPVNSGSLPADLLESTLFGHVKGAFTSAIHTKKGYFEVADHGTIFFDEIGTIERPCRPSCCASSRRRSSSRWARPSLCAWTCVFWPPPPAI